MKGLEIEARKRHPQAAAAAAVDRGTEGYYYHPPTRWGGQAVLRPSSVHAQPRRPGANRPGPGARPAGEPMTFDDLPTGATVFVDANIFIYYFEPHPVFGPPCQQLFLRI